VELRVAALHTPLGVVLGALVAAVLALAAVFAIAVPEFVATEPHCH
jgi:hypothetical protein